MRKRDLIKAQIRRDAIQNVTRYTPEFLRLERQTIHIERTKAHIHYPQRFGDKMADGLETSDATPVVWEGKPTSIPVYVIRKSGPSGMSKPGTRTKAFLRIIGKA